MSSIVLELQNMATDSSIDVMDLLRKALLVASKLGIDDFVKWIRSELDGYDLDDTIPKYRQVRADMKVFNPYQGLIPFHLPPDWEDSFCDIELKAPIGAVVNIANERGKSGGKQSDPIIPLSSEHKKVLMDIQEWPVLEPVRTASPTYLTNITDAVRSTILNWSLKLEQEGILGQGLSFSVEEKERAAESREVHIQNFQGILGDVSGGVVSQENSMNVVANDFDSLRAALTGMGVESADIETLHEAIKADGTPANSEIGAKVSGWIGGMISKAKSGASAVSGSLVANAIFEAICAYYGI